jgi:hypothetical protein
MLISGAEKKTLRKCPLGRQSRRCEDTIKMDLREIGFEDQRWVDVTCGRVQYLSDCSAAVLKLGSFTSVLVNTKTKMKLTRDPYITQAQLLWI